MTAKRYKWEPEKLGLFGHYLKKLNASSKSKEELQQMLNKLNNSLYKRFCDFTGTTPSIHFDEKCNAIIYSLEDRCFEESMDR